MTQQQAIQKVVDLATSQVGVKEGANNWNKYAAELDPLGITYGAKQNLAWCGEFILWLFVKCFGIVNGLKMLCSPNPSGIPLCSLGAKYFKDAGRWTTKPAVGNIIFFNISGGINHTGIVVYVSGSYITTVEGNSSDKVSRNTYSTSEIGGKIAGFGIPKWEVAADEPADETPPEIIVTEKCEVTLPLVSFGDESETVRAVQLLLIGRGYTCGSWGADGEFGAATKAAVLNFQRAHNLEADGVVGKQTYSTLMGV